jgi:formylglycine-generating enzyme required for sulfatase activity
MPLFVAAALVAVSEGAPRREAPGPGARARIQVRRDAATGVEFVHLPAGRFLMGSPPDEAGRRADEVRHEVVLSTGFWIGRGEVTRAQWERVMGGVESHSEKPNPFRHDDPRLPMVSVSFREVQEYLRRLQGLSPGRFRLPTEAEWEYACRAGTTTAFATGASLGSDDASFDARFPIGGAPPGPQRRRPSIAGTFPANAWGLHDLPGNVWEWVADWYGPYPPGPARDPKGPITGTRRVLRGGSWAFGAGDARCASRYHHSPDDWGYSVGFRLVWEPARRPRAEPPS